MQQEPSQRRFGPASWLATGFGIGLAPVAPGTFGSLLGLPLAWAVGLAPWWGQLGLILLLAVVSVPICTAASRELGGLKDPGAVVLDEIIALPVTLFMVPLNGSPVQTVALLAAGFVVFRIFDISKPPPARQLERLPEGLGIVTDDLVAGVYGCLTMHALLLLAALVTGGEFLGS